jgi:hypothetical protein
VAKNEKDPRQFEAVLLPGAYRNFTSQIPEYQRVVDEKATVYYVFVLEYRYSKNQKGKYEIIGHKTPAIGLDEIDYEFVQ